MLEGDIKARCNMQSKIQIIQCITVLSTPNRIYEVGEETKDGRVIIDIKQVGSEYEDHVHSEYHVLDEDGELITNIENCPVIVEYEQFDVDGELPFTTCDPSNDLDDDTPPWL